jgi:D-alanyl-D-alanine carboxypeptidase
MVRKQHVSFALTALAASLTLSNPGLVRADHGASLPLTQVDTYLQTQMHSRRIPGLSVAVVRNGSVILQRSYGLANVELDAPTSPGSVFEIGTLSKQFTAAAVMMLVQDGQVRLFDPIRSHMPELPGSWSYVTVRNLLTHTSGIPSYTSVPGFNSARHTSITRKQILDSIASLPMRGVPGEKWTASNTDYFLLALLIERVSGKSYSRFLTERIFQPVGMTSTRVNDYTRPIEDRVDGYALDDDSQPTLVISTHPTRLFGSGSIVSSVVDLARWESALARQTLLRPASLAEMGKPTKLYSGESTEYGFGWYVHPSSQWGTIVENSGGTAGFRSSIARYAADKTTVIVLTNRESVNPYTLADGVHRIISGSAVITQ